MKIKLKIEWKLLTTMVLSVIVMLPVVFQGYFIGSVSTKKVEELYNKSIAGNMESMSINIDFYLNHMEDFARALSMDQSLIQMLGSDDTDNNNIEIRERISAFTQFYRIRIPLYIQIIAEDGAVYSDMPLYDSEKESLKSIVKPFAPRQFKLDSNSVFLNVDRDYHEQLKDNHAVYVSKNIVSQNKYMGHLVVQMNQSLIQRMMHQIHLQNFTTVFISDLNGMVLLTDEGNKEDLSGISKTVSQKAADASKEYFSFRLDWKGKPYVCSVRLISNQSWYMVALTPVDQIYEGTRDIRNSTFLVMGISIGIIVLVMLVFAKKLTSPIFQLTKIMRRVRLDEMPNQRYRYQGIEEIEVLSAGMNRMLDRIESQLHQIKKDEREKRDLELNLLQSQIRPHFLHNALNSIRWMAEMKGEKTISKALISLSSMLHYTLSKSSSIWSTIGDEFHYLKSYIIFQEIRLAQSIEVDYRLDDCLLRLNIPKLTLQPIVENAILHGFSRLEGRLPKLDIHLQKDGDDIFISIQDNGIGMDSAAMDNFMHNQNDHPKTASLSGIGMVNIQKRLQLEFGSLYGIHLDSQLGVGTKVTVVIPYCLRSAIDK